MASSSLASTSLPSGLDSCSIEVWIVSYNASCHGTPTHDANCVVSENNTKAVLIEKFLPPTRSGSVINRFTPQAMCYVLLICSNVQLTNKLLGMHEGNKRILKQTSARKAR